MSKFYCRHCGHELDVTPYPPNKGYADETPLEDIDMSVRLRHCLTGDYYPVTFKPVAKTVGELKRMPDEELLKIRHLGKGTLGELRRFAPFIEE